MPLIIKTTGLEEFLDAQGEATIKALILGEPSAGKTRSASAWPRPIFADCEGGLMSVADRGVPYATIKSSSDMDALLTALEIECKVRTAADRKYQTLVIDTLDSYQRLVIQEILRAGRKEAMSGWADWGQLDAKMTALVARLNALPMNIVVNLHTKTTKDGDDGPLVKEPKLKGDLREQIAAEFDLVGHMATFWEAENGERVLKRAIKWFPEPGFPILKDRSGQLPHFTPVDFTEEDYCGLFNAVFGQTFDTLSKGHDVETLNNVEDLAPPVEPHPGGPVKPAKKVAVKAAAKAEPAPKAESKPKVLRTDVPPAKSTGATPAQPPAAEPAVSENARSDAETGEDSVATPVATPSSPPTTEEAVAQVTETLGGQVVSDSAGAEPPSKPAADVLPCGTAAQNVTDPVPGCGRDLRAMEGVGDLVNIGLIKTKTYLCPDCLGIWRREHAAK